jgi:electron transport complex protein RnfB
MVEVKVIDEVLPQTQCGECGYSGCLPYAEALSRGEIAIDRCPPGGVTTLRALGELLNIDPAPYLSATQANTRLPAVAFIREAECIGCTKCIQSCPVDAIVGTGKEMHSVIRHECTGCGLCIDPCPVDCIDMLPLPELNFDKQLARERYQSRQSRFLHDEQEKQQIYREKSQLVQENQDTSQDLKAKQAYILEAVARVQAKNNE